MGVAGLAAKNGSLVGTSPGAWIGEEPWKPPFEDPKTESSWRSLLPGNRHHVRASPAKSLRDLLFLRGDGAKRVKVRGHATERHLELTEEFGTEEARFFRAVLRARVEVARLKSVGHSSFVVHGSGVRTTFVPRSWSVEAEAFALGSDVVVQSLKQLEKTDEKFEELCHRLLQERGICAEGIFFDKSHILFSFVIDIVCPQEEKSYGLFLAM